MNKEIPIFFATDDNYVPYMAACIESIKDHAKKDRIYDIKILHTNVNEENQNKIHKYNKGNIKIEFIDLREYINDISDKLFTRDYYTNTTYFRLFLPDLYPNLKKVIYIDCDTILLDDIANLFDIDIKDNLLGAVPDQVIQIEPVFQEYVEKVVGIKTYKNYFNAGVLIMNLDELRKINFQEKFLYLLGVVRYSVVQDQDYLNRICKGRVKILEPEWDAMPIYAQLHDEENLKLVHYNLADKPWHYDDIPFGDYFWKYAKKTAYYDLILKAKKSYSLGQKQKDALTYENLKALAKMEAECIGDDRIPEEGRNFKQDEHRLELNRRIEEYERLGKFDIDVEDDPPTIPLEPNEVDFLRKKISNKVKAKYANHLALSFFHKLIRDGKVIIKDVNGMDNLKKLKDTGFIITCNHFNPMDTFTVEKIFHEYKSNKKQKLYKVIREGNYTNFPGFYGLLMRNCYTLPLAENHHVLAEFMEASNKLLQKKEAILIFPEQSMWLNYRKPKPLKNGAFHIAYKNKVPILPIFITMEDTDKLDDDGFFIQAYTVNIGNPIYIDPKLDKKDNIEQMKNKNYEIWKNTYEDFYKTKLTYTTEE